jgi:hypothetical protein
MSFSFIYQKYKFRHSGCLMILVTNLTSYHSHSTPRRGLITSMWRVSQSQMEIGELSPVYGSRGWKNLFWLMVSKVLVHGHLAPMLRSCWGRTLWWGTCGGVKCLTSWGSGSKRERKTEEGARDKTRPPKNMPSSVTYFLQLGPTS